MSDFVGTEMEDSVSGTLWGIQQHTRFYPSHTSGSHNVIMKMSSDFARGPLWLREQKITLVLKRLCSVVRTRGSGKGMLNLSYVNKKL